MTRRHSTGNKKKFSRPLGPANDCRKASIFASFFFLCFRSFGFPRPFILIHSRLESFLSQAARSDYRGGGGRRCMGVGRRIAQRLALLPPPSLTSFPPTAELPGCCHGNRLGCGLIVPGPSGEKKSMLVMKNPTRSSINV